MPHKDSYEKTPGGIWRPCGDLQPVFVTQPAAGANLSHKLDEGGVYRFVSLLMTVVNDANVASRTMNLTFAHGGLTFLQLQSATSVAASLTRLFLFSCLGAQFTGAVNLFHIPTPHNFFLPGGTTIATSITNIQVGDQISAIGLFVEFYPGAGEY